jgi:hypothetical protein
MHLLQYTHHPLLQQHKTKQNKILKKIKTFTFAKATTRKQIFLKSKPNLLQTITT